MEADARIFHRFPFRPLVRPGTTLPGKFPSQLAGEGLEFYGLREYTPGDSAKKIIWKHYAKSGKLMVREEIRETNMRLWLMQDLSSSMSFGKKPDLVRAFYAFLNHLLHEGGNALGIVAFTDKVAFFYRPSASPRVVKITDRLAHELKSSDSDQKRTSISVSCSFAVKYLRRGDVIFMVSDFFSSENLEEALRQVALHQEFIPVVVRDAREVEFPRGARVAFKDMETGQTYNAFGKKNNGEYNENLEKVLRKFCPLPLWLEGESFADAIKKIAEWLYRRNKH